MSDIFDKLRLSVFRIFKVFLTNLGLVYLGLFIKVYF